MSVNCKGQEGGNRKSVNCKGQEGSASACTGQPPLCSFPHLVVPHKPDTEVFVRRPVFDLEHARPAHGIRVAARHVVLEKGMLRHLMDAEASAVEDLQQGE